MNNMDYFVSVACDEWVGYIRAQVNSGPRKDNWLASDRVLGVSLMWMGDSGYWAKTSEVPTMISATTAVGAYNEDIKTGSRSNGR